MAVLEFNGYRVNKMIYTRNENFDSKTKSISMTPKLNTNFDVKGNKIIVSLNVEVGSTENASVPFLAECSLTGIFTYRHEEDKTDIGLDTLVRNNAVAILYPYIRTIISTLSMTSNEFPNYNLPIINVGKVLSDQAN